jgi:tRNA dimethylallyltransferase
LEDSDNKKKTVIGIVGPTGSGKSSLALKFAERWNKPVELVCLDSRQVYKDAIIGTASPDKNDMEVVPHHLYNILSPEEKVSAGKYVGLAKDTFVDIFKRGAVPVLVGGTGFYLKALIEGLPDLPQPDEEIRERLMKLYREWDSTRLHFLLNTIDPESAGKIHPKDTYRVIRALEVYYQTGKPLSTFEPVREEDDIDYLIFGLLPEREALYGRINERVEAMMVRGLLEEVKDLLRTYDINSPIFEGIGYREFLEYFEGRVKLDEVVDDIKKHTRHYAKRQITWFKSVHGIWWLPLALEGNTGGEVELQLKALMDGLERWGYL